MDGPSAIKHTTTNKHKASCSEGQREDLPQAKHPRQPWSSNRKRKPCQDDEGGEDTMAPNTSRPRQDVALLGPPLPLLPHPWHLPPAGAIEYKCPSCQYTVGHFGPIYHMVWPNTQYMMAQLGLEPISSHAPPFPVACMVSPQQVGLMTPIAPTTAIPTVVASTVSAPTTVAPTVAAPTAVAHNLPTVAEAPDAPVLAVAQVPAATEVHIPVGAPDDAEAAHMLGIA